MHERCTVSGTALRLAAVRHHNKLPQSQCNLEHGETPPALKVYVHVCWTLKTALLMSTVSSVTSAHSVGVVKGLDS